MNLEILKIASNTDNHKVLNNHTHHSKLKNPICGDVMHIDVKVVAYCFIDERCTGPSPQANVQSIQYHIYIRDNLVRYPLLCVYCVHQTNNPA